jgi:Transposase IS4
MSRNRFDDILSSLVYTNKEPTIYKDRFFEIRQLVDCWNANMAANFSPGWVTCLDESMMTWTNQFTCPGFMLVPRKPHPFGNEWHSICDGITGIMFAVEIVEGKDAPPERGASLHDNMGKTVGLLLRLTQSIYHSGKVIILDSGFCVLKGLIELRKKGLYASALIKKRRYWPKHVKGDDVKNHFDSKAISDSEAWYGTYDNHPWHLFAMKGTDVRHDAHEYVRNLREDG